MAKEFSPIQNHILSKLKNARNLRYSDLQPQGIPNDLFNYHLQFLVKKGFLDHNDEGYALAESGIKHVADPDISDGQAKIASLFKFNVITIVSRVVNGKIEILSQVRKSHPSFGKVGVMGGIVRKGEPLENAATRKLKTETGLDAKLRLVGIERRMMYVDNELFSDVLFPITYTDTYTGELISDSDYGHNHWVPIDEAIQNESIEFDSIKKIVDVLKAIRDKNIGIFPFFYQEEIQVKP
jgi:ADP-ribose pyrophosphatase YjhB (NUDIX family)